jgi:hypothetical protein
MARVVLLIEPDVDELGTLASRLRTHGLEVAIADNLEHGAERARTVHAGVLLVSSVIATEPDFAQRLEWMPSLASLPRFVLVDGIGSRSNGEIPRWDVEAIAKRVHALGQSV